MEFEIDSFCRSVDVKARLRDNSSFSKFRCRNEIFISGTKRNFTGHLG